MATETQRPKLHLYNISSLLRQAFITCWASISLLLIIALLSSVYETAMERFLPGFSISSSNLNFSFQFSLDPNQPSFFSRHNRLAETEQETIANRLAETEEKAIADSLAETEEKAIANRLAETEEKAVANRLAETEEKAIADRLAETEEEAIADRLAETEEEAIAVDSTKTHLPKPALRFKNVNNSSKPQEKESIEDMTDLSFFTGRLLGGRGLDQGAMPQGEMMMLLLLLVLLLALTCLLAIVGLQHSVILGSVVYSVVSTYMGKKATTFQAARAGFKSGIGRLMWLSIIHTTLSSLLDVLFTKALRGGVMDMKQVEELVIQMSHSPFAFMAPFRDTKAINLGMQYRIALFIALEYIADGLLYTVYIVACWVSIMERNFWGFRAFYRSWSLVKSMETQAFGVKLLESVICGASTHWLLAKVFGRYLATLVICIAQAYFLVLWLIVYFSARSLHDGASQFSHRSLDDFLDRLK